MCGALQQSFVMSFTRQLCPRLDNTDVCGALQDNCVKALQHSCVWIFTVCECAGETNVGNCSKVKLPAKNLSDWQYNYSYTLQIFRQDTN